MNEGLGAFIALTQKYVDMEELTQAIVNEYIKIWIFSLFPNLLSQKQSMNAEKRRGPCANTVHCLSTRQNSYLSLLRLDFGIFSAFLLFFTKKT